MSLIVSDSESILDVAGNAIGVDAATFLKAIDRLMTVGTYYSLEHEQYRLASEKACATMVAAIRPRRSLPVEVAAAGLVIDGHTLDPRLRVVRQLHDLLVSLNIAHLEFTAELTPDALRQALAALHEHRLALGQAQSFQEITIDNLPSSVSVASRRVVGGMGGGGYLLSPEDILDALGTDPLNPDDDGQTRDPAEFLREIMDLLRHALGGSGAAPSDGTHIASATLPTRDELAGFRQALQHLLAGRPDAATLAHLMSLSRQAAAVSADSSQTRLIFNQLRQSVGQEPAPTAPPSAAEAEFVGGTTSVGALAAQVAELAGRNVQIPDPGPTARCDQLALGFRLLSAGVAPPTSGHVLDALRATCRRPELGEAEAAVIAGSLKSLAEAGRSDLIDRAAPLMAELRQSHPELVSAVWSKIAGECEPAARTALWPHLVNDLLLGLAPAPDSVIAQLCLRAGELGFDQAVTQAARLSELPCALGAPLADDIFHVPPARARCVHAALLHTPAAGNHGPLLHRALARRPLDALTGVLMNAVGSYGPHHKALFLSLLREGGLENGSQQLLTLASTLLAQELDNLTGVERHRTWAPEAIAWLGRLAPGAARPVLQRVLTERRWLWRHAWPEACRAAAAAALADRPGEG